MKQPIQHQMKLRNENTWAIHQLYTTPILSKKQSNWFTGGLNHQVEHHLLSILVIFTMAKLQKL
jgi:fatty acid desaturase